MKKIKNRLTPGALCFHFREQCITPCLVYIYIYKYKLKGPHNILSYNRSQWGTQRSFFPCLSLSLSLAIYSILNSTKSSFNQFSPSPLQTSLFAQFRGPRGAQLCRDGGGRGWRSRCRHAADDGQGGAAKIGWENERCEENGVPPQGSISSSVLRIVEV